MPLTWLIWLYARNTRLELPKPKKEPPNFASLRKTQFETSRALRIRIDFRRLRRRSDTLFSLLVHIATHQLSRYSNHDWSIFIFRSRMVFRTAMHSWRYPLYFSKSRRGLLFRSSCVYIFDIEQPVECCSPISTSF